MFFSVLHNQSGEEEVVKIAKKDEHLEIIQLIENWVYVKFAGEATLCTKTGHIPSGCGEYYAEIRNSKHATSSCWCSADFYLEVGDY